MDDFHDLKTNSLRENVLKTPCIGEVIWGWKKNSENDKTNREVEKKLNDEDVAKLALNTKGSMCRQILNTSIDIVLRTSKFRKFK